MTIAEHTDAYAGRWLGKYIDEDRAYGSQCWDVVARYAREEWGCPFFPTVSGGAEGLWRIFSPPIRSYFYKVAPKDLAKGDIAVWDGSFYPPYGHTALVMRVDPDGILVMEQDGSDDRNGDGKADGVSYLKKRSLYKVAGGLRPIGGIEVDDRIKIVGAPSSVSWGEGRIDTFARGSDGGLWHKWYDIKVGGGFQAWEKIGGGIATSPDVTSWGEGRLDIFATGVAGDLMHFWYDGDGFKGPESLGIPKGSI